MAEDHPAIAAHKPALKPQKLVARYKSFALLESDAPLLAKLPEYQRELLQSPGSYQELAERFSLPVGTVRSRLHRARAALTNLRATAGSEQSQSRGNETAH